MPRTQMPQIRNAPSSLHATRQWSCLAIWFQSSQQRQDCGKHQRAVTVSSESSRTHGSPKLLPASFRFAIEGLSMSAIESLLQENRVFPPPATFGQERSHFRHGRIPGAVRRGRARLRGLLGPAGAREPALEQAVHQDAGRIRRAVLQMVRGRQAERLLQLPGPPPGNGNARTRPRSSSRPTTARSPRSPTRNCMRASASSPTA